MSAISGTLVDEITVGNITHSLTKDVLKKISSEVKRSTRLHNDLMLELMRTQKVIRESSSHASFKGYLQHLQIDPFALNIPAQHPKNNITWHSPPRCSRQRCPENTRSEQESSGLCSPTCHRTCLKQPFSSCHITLAYAISKDNIKQNTTKK